PYDSLANCWFQPLTHLSSNFYPFLRAAKIGNHFRLTKKNTGPGFLDPVFDIGMKSITRMAYLVTTSLNDSS
ncbi:MAG: hypothetical protein WCK09_20900, partial [Bacteroidota bacterium]